MKRIVFICIAICEGVFAQHAYNIALTNMIDALVRPNGTLDSSFTNQLAAYTVGMMNALHVANIDLVRAISLVDMAEEEAAGDNLLPQAIAICSNMLASTGLPTNTWQRGVAGVVLVGIYSFDGKRSAARYNAINCVSLAAHSISLDEDFVLWNAIAKHLDVEGLSVQDAIRCYSAVAVLADDPSSNVYSYTNGLPETILVKIREIPEL